MAAPELGAGVRAGRSFERRGRTERDGKEHLKGPPVAVGVRPRHEAIRVPR